MSRSSGRAQVEPLAALVALAVVCAGLSLYAGALDGALALGRSDDADSSAAPVVDRVRTHLAPAGVADPDGLDGVVGLAPDGRRLNATVACRHRTWATGPEPPAGADRATESVAVRLAPGRVEPCRLAVVVWS